MDGAKDAEGEREFLLALERAGQITELDPVRGAPPPPRSLPAFAALAVGLAAAMGLALAVGGKPAPAKLGGGLPSELAEQAQAAAQAGGGASGLGARADGSPQAGAGAPEDLLAQAEAAGRAGGGVSMRLAARAARSQGDGASPKPGLRSAP